MNRVQELSEIGLTSHASTLDVISLSKLRNLIPSFIPPDHQTRYWKNISITPELIQLLKQALKPYLDSLQKLGSHNQVCESIYMATTPGEPGQLLHVDNYAPLWLAKWYTIGICLTPIDTQIGTFDYVPRSHHLYNDVTISDVEKIEFEHTQELANSEERELIKKDLAHNISKLSLPAGSTFCYNTSLLHKGTANQSLDAQREVYFITFGPNFSQWSELMKLEAPELVRKTSFGRNSLKQKKSEQLSEYTLQHFQ